LEVEPVQPTVTDRAVRALAPLRDASAAHATSAIPRTVALFAALGLDDAASEPGALAERLVERWSVDRGYTLQAPLGITAEGVMKLDLVSDGPHALIGGTSGRGKDLEEMLAGHPEEAPPSLVIVVDEFATLVKEVPDFVPGIVDIAQRGRSLGIHLILATQRPSGSVNDNILANTNARISLRMLDGADSNSIIVRPDAAAIPVPLRSSAL